MMLIKTVGSALVLSLSLFGNAAFAQQQMHNMHHHHQKPAEPEKKTEVYGAVEGGEESQPDEALQMAHMHHGEPMDAWVISQFSVECGPDESWSPVHSMCMPMAVEGSKMRHLMLSGNAFLVGIAQSGPRGKDRVASPNWLMLDAGESFGGKHFFGVSLMATAEKWTFPEEGYPLLLQTGESHEDGRPFVDAQHPHSSPIMGLTFSDTIRFSNASPDHLQVFFAPRGSSTDGPIAFMHRPTGMVNPDAPLGHHIGQDVGHITSTVVGAALHTSNSILEVSGFNGTEPEPTEVDLPLGKINSGAIRLTHFFSAEQFGMISAAYVDDPEGGHEGALDFDAQVTHEMRYSASIYRRVALMGGMSAYNTLIYGGRKTFGIDTYLNSINYEFLVQSMDNGVWGRIELLQRTPAELLISNVANPFEGRWVSAVTLGWTHRIADFGSARLNAGISGTKDLLPQEFIGAYGGNPWTGKVFLELSGMKMWGDGG
jgi:hypothetical protein